MRSLAFPISGFLARGSQASSIASGMFPIGVPDYIVSVLFRDINAFEMPSSDSGPNCPMGQSPTKPAQSSDLRWNSGLVPSLRLYPLHLYPLSA